MARFNDRQPQFRIVNSIGLVIEGPYRFDVASGAPETYGVTFDGADASEHEEYAGQWTNFAWQRVGYALGYRYAVSLRFVACEASAFGNYGLTLLHHLWRTAVETQLTYGGLQFSMYQGAAWHPVVPDSGQGWAPTPTAGKQGFFDVTMAFQTRNLVATPGEWAVAQW